MWTAPVLPGTSGSPSSNWVPEYQRQPIHHLPLHSFRTREQVSPGPGAPPALNSSTRSTTTLASMPKSIISAPCPPFKFRPSCYIRYLHFYTPLGSPQRQIEILKICVRGSDRLALGIFSEPIDKTHPDRGIILSSRIVSFLFIFSHCLCFFTFVYNFRVCVRYLAQLEPTKLEAHYYLSFQFQKYKTIK